MDLDSILYIVIILITLIVSALGSSRRKKARQMQESGQAPAEGYDPDAGDMTEQPGSYQAAEDPFTRLEEFLTGNIRTEPREQTMDPTTTMRDRPAESLEEDARVVSMEGESLETIVDEEAVYLEEKEAWRVQYEQADPLAGETAENDDLAEDISAEQDPGTETGGLFADPDEIRRAVIYNEIFRRKF